MPVPPPNHKGAEPWENTSSSSEADSGDSPVVNTNLDAQHSPLDGHSPMEYQFNYDHSHDTSNIRVPYWRGQEDIVISGVSCRLPESDNMAELEHNLMNSIDMITGDGRRWEPGFYDLPKRSGKLKEIKKFDATFFGVHPKQAHTMDPQLRLLLEVVYEAIADSGMNIKDIRGSKTGVFVGASASESGAAATKDPEQIIGYSLTGTVRSMFSNRISFSFDFQGPSYTVDTACSSALQAFQLAVEAMRTGDCDAAIVAGTNLTLTPTTALQFLRLGMLSPEGKCQSFDASGDGYVRSEGVVAIYLQRESAARRIYSHVIHAKCNTDGFKEQGITFPSGERQAQLLKEVYEEASVDPADVKFIETHGTGTKVGDPLEANSITQVFCENRTEPLLIGSTKSNLGHCEPASGLASLAKVIIGTEAGLIPPNLHFKEPNPNIPALLDGRLKVVTEKTPWNGGLIGVNSFGFGGSNAHVVLRADPIKRDPIVMPKGPKIFCYSGRTKEAVEHVLNYVVAHPDDHYLYSFLQEQNDTAANMHPYRGYMLYNRENAAGKMDPQKEVIKTFLEKRPVWFIYSGMGTQWNGMGREMMQYEVFSDIVDRCSEALKPFGMSVRKMIMEGDDETYKDTLVSFVCIATIQVALTELLKTLGIEPDGILGHSVGELGCSYADGCMTPEETVLCAYWRGVCVKGAKLPPGGMAAVGMSWQETLKRCPEGVVPACNNAEDSVTVSGPADAIKKFVADLQEEGVFAKEVNSSGRAFHSYFMAPIGPELKSSLETVIKHPKLRTERWISSSVAESEWGTDAARFCSPTYHANNLMSPVLFYEGIQKIPDNAIVLELAPHCLLQAILRRCLKPTCMTMGVNFNVSIPPAKGKPKIESNLEFLKTTLGKMYVNGLNVYTKHLYPAIQYPVPTGVPMISSLVKWDHNQTWDIMTFTDVIAFGSGGKVTSCSFIVDPFNPDVKEQFFLDHQIDGKALFPFTGYLYLAWRGICRVHGIDLNKTPVIFENVTCLRATMMTKAVKFDISVSASSGDFEIMEGDSLLSSGKIRFVTETDPPFFYDDINRYPPDSVCERIELKTADIYKEMQLRGYEYGPAFQGIHKACNSGDRSTIIWNNNWVTFLDSLLQCALLREKGDSLKLPVRLRYLRIDPIKHRDFVVEMDDLQVVHGRTDATTNGCCAGGIEVRELTCTTVPRRLHAQQQVSIEKVFFLPHFSTECFLEYPKIRTQLHEYRDFLIPYIDAGLKQLVDIVKKSNVKMPNADNFSTAVKKLSGQIMSGSAKDLAQIDSYVNCTGNKFGLAKVWSKVLEEITKGGAEVITNIANLLQNPDNQQLLESDIFLQSSWLDRPLKLLLDVTLETTGGHAPKFNHFEPTSLKLPLLVRALVQTHPLVEDDWTIIGPNVDSFDEATLEPHHFKAVKFNLMSKEITPDKPRNFDATFLDCSLSRTPDIKKYLGRVKDFLRTDGFVIVNEVTNLFELAFALDSLKSTEELEVLPAFEELSERKFGRYYSHNEWLEIFKSCGFKVAIHQSDSLMHTVYLLHKIPPAEKQPIFIDIDDNVNFTWIKPIQEALEERMNASQDHTIWTVSNKLTDNGAVGFALCLREESVKNRIRSLMDASLKERNIQHWTLESPAVKEHIETDLFSSIYRDGQWGSFRHLPVKMEDISSDYKVTEHAFINTVIRGDLSSLTWFESSNKYFYQQPKRTSNQFLCSVYYASLNFRDIMLATGRLAVDSIPGNFADKECVLGMEFSGRDNKTGVRVMGLMPAQALATTVVGDMRFAWDVPDHWTMEQAATVPVVYTTVFYSLILRGRLKRGERVLIHAGSGGVGQAAIAVCLHYGCEVFTTVSSDEKKNFLKTRFPQLKDRNFSSSRSTQFEYDILHATRGRGVHLVLNSLSEDKLQASLRCLAQHGRFLEIGKFDLSNDTKMGMAFFLKNVTFHGILLDSLFEEENEDWVKVSQLFSEGIRSGVVQPLNATVFDSDKPEEAFRYMAHGKHIGKVLIKVRTEEAKALVLPQPVFVHAICRTLCHPQRVYIVTGGLGGFGLELAQWLINRGAKKLILTSRAGIKTGYQARCVYFWRRMGISVLISTINLASEEEAERMIEQAKEIGPIGGIFHLALVLRDSLFENQNVKNFQESAVSKYWGAKHLDEMTRKMCDAQLEWFVIFSSISCGRGNSGQTNYGWSNSAMERIVEQRRFDGYHALAVQWGAIGDVGVVLENMGDNQTVVGGTLPQRMPACLSTLDMFLTWQHPIVSSFIRAEIGQKKHDSGTVDVIQSIAHILGVSDSSQLDPDANLGDLGLDSLMGVEIKQALERDYDVVLSMKDIRSLTLNKVKALVDAGGGAAGAALVKSTKSETQLNDDGEGSESELGEGDEVEKAEGSEVEEDDLDEENLGKREKKAAGEEETEEKVEKAEKHHHHHKKDDEEEDKETSDQMALMNFFRLRVDVNSLRPELPVIKINNVTEGPAVFCVHAIEGVGAVLANLASKINLPVYCFQCVPEAPLDTIESLAAFYVEEMMKIQPKGPYRLVGYSYGASVAFDMALHLQHLYPDDPNVVAHLILLDGSHAYMQNYRKVYRMAYNVVNDAVFETEVLCAFTMRFAHIDYKNFRKELLVGHNWQSRVQQVVDKVMTSGLFENPDVVEYAAETLCKKLQAADRYFPNQKFKGDITLIKAEVGGAKPEIVGHDYGIGKVATGKCEVHVMPGDHDAFVEGKTSAEAGRLIESIMRGESK